MNLDQVRILMPWIHCPYWPELERGFSAEIILALRMERTS